MSGKNERITWLIHQYLNQELTPDEEEELRSWVEKESESRQFFHDLTQIDNLKGKLDVFYSIRRDAIWSKTQHKWSQDKVKPMVPWQTFIKNWTWLAAALLLIGSSTFIWYKNQQITKTATSRASQEILPGRNKATLRLTSGKEIDLADDKNGIRVTTHSTTYHNGAKIADVASSKMDVKEPDYVLITPRGGQYQVTLSDGTHVWLNASSSISYPAAFGPTNRTVTVTGETFFQVAEDHHKPFRILTKTQEVDVLGTELNLNAYENEGNIRTTLISGAVRVKHLKDSLRLSPGEASVLSFNTTYSLTPFIKQEANIEATIAWRKGRFDFNSLEFDQVMRQLERWYDIEVHYEGSIPKKTFWGQMTRMVKLTTILAFLKESGVNYRLEGRKLFIQST